jgi:hypothetical protein
VWPGRCKIWLVVVAAYGAGQAFHQGPVNRRLNVEPIPVVCGFLIFQVWWGRSAPRIQEQYVVLGVGGGIGLEAQIARIC